MLYARIAIYAFCYDTLHCVHHKLFCMHQQLLFSKVLLRTLCANILHVRKYIAILAIYVLHDTH